MVSFISSTIVVIYVKVGVCILLVTLCILKRFKIEHSYL